MMPLLNLFVPVADGDDFHDIVEDEFALQLAFIAAVGGNFLLTVTDSFVEVETYSHSFTYDTTVHGHGCPIKVVCSRFAKLSFETGVLTNPYTCPEVEIVKSDASSCGIRPLCAEGEDYTPGTWAAVGGAPAFPYGAFLRPSPLPTSAPFLGAALTGQGAVSSRACKSA